MNVVLGERMALRVEALNVPPERIRCSRSRGSALFTRGISILSSPAIHLVSLRPSLEGLIVPSKFHGVTAVGRPTLFIGDQDGEIAALVARYECGMTVPQGDSAALALAVLALAGDPEGRARMGTNARRAFETDFAKSIAVRRWRKLLTEITRSGSSSENPRHRSALG